MASYIANNQSRDTVTIMLSRAEADALHDLATHAGKAFDHFGDKRNGKTKSACKRALKALQASTNNNARRAGYFDI